MQWECKRFADLSPEELYRLLQLRVDVFVVEQRCPYPELDGKDPEALHVFAWDETGFRPICGCCGRAFPSRKPLWEGWPHGRGAKAWERSCCAGG